MVADEEKNVCQFVSSSVRQFVRQFVCSSVRSVVSSSVRQFVRLFVGAAVTVKTACLLLPELHACVFLRLGLLSHCIRAAPSSVRQFVSSSVRQFVRQFVSSSVLPVVSSSVRQFVSSFVSSSAPSQVLDHTSDWGHTNDPNTS